MHSSGFDRIFSFFFSFQRFPSCSLRVEYSNDPISNFYRQPRGEAFDFATIPRQNGKHEQRYTDTVNFSVSRLLENFVVCFASASRIDEKTIRKDQPLPPWQTKSSKTTRYTMQTTTIPRIAFRKPRYPFPRVCVEKASCTVESTCIHKRI